MLNELSKSDIAGILTAGGFAIREGLTLFDSLEELGFCDIDITQIKDVSDDEGLINLSFFYLAELSKKY